MTRQLAIYIFMGALITPLLIWALLARMARRNPQLLAKIHPFVKILTWGLWMSAIVFALLAIIGRKTFISVSAIVFAFYGGINLMHGWIRKRIKSNSPATTDVLWPTPKNF